MEVALKVRVSVRIAVGKVIDVLLKVKLKDEGEHVAVVSRALVVEGIARRHPLPMRPTCRSHQRRHALAIKTFTL